MEIIRKYFSELAPLQLEQLGRLQELYTDWNAKINVISRKDMTLFYEHHVLHSLAIAHEFNFPNGYKVMDLGAGGGFPGIPLAIYFPEVSFLLVDSINKKLKVVHEVASELGLRNVNILHSRAEDIRDKKFDVIVSRAVAPLKDLLNWSRPLFKVGDGQKAIEQVSGLICLKGGDLTKEIAESGSHPKVYEIEKIFSEDYFRDKYILNVRR